MGLWLIAAIEQQRAESDRTVNDQVPGDEIE